MTNMGQIPAQSNGGTMPPMSFNKQLIFMKPNNKGTKNLICGTASCETTTSRREDRRRLTAKEVEKFDKEMKEFFKNYKSPIGSESG